MMERKGFDQMTEEIQRLMSEFFKDVKPLGYQPERCFYPPMDIYETEEDLVIVLEIAGMRTEDIHVSLEEDLLTISGTRMEPSSPSKTQFHQMEIDYGTFERSLRIPFPLEAGEIKAVYRQGFLTVTVPKVSQSTSKTVEVKIQ